MDFSKRFNDEIMTVSGTIEAVSVRTSSLKIKGAWYKLTDRTEGAKKINIVKAGLNVEITYKAFHRPSIEINYLQSIKLLPVPEQANDLVYELHSLHRKQNEVECRINWYLDHKTSDELLVDPEYKALEAEAWELFHKEQEITDKQRRLEEGGPVQKSEAA